MEELFDLPAFPFDHTDLADILQKHHELIATGTTHDIRSPEHGLQTYCQAAEHFISEGMSHSIIDLLKVINIQYEQYALLVRVLFHVFPDLTLCGHLIVQIRQ